MQLRSDAVKKGLARAPHRSLLKADGLTDEEMERPLVAIFNSRNDIIPGHNNLDKIAEAVKAGVYMAGGVPIEISTIGVCDGIAMNHNGMHYSLVSRETIADSFEIAMEGHQFDAAVCIPNCDKIVPGMILGALRVNVPTVFVSGGPMLPGHQRGRNDGPTTDLNSLFDGVGQVQTGTMSADDLAYLENSACPTCGSCSGMFTANSMNCLCEALGIALPGNGTIPAVYSERLRLAKHAGMKVMELLQKSVRIKDIVTAAAVHNAMECDMAFGGSTNTVLHLTAIAMEAGCPITMDDWDAASARTPHLVKLQPSGPRPLIDLYAVGGVPVVMQELHELGLLDESALTCMGTVPEYLERCGKPAGERIGPADVPGEQRNDEIRPLVEAEHRRIRPFVADIRRDLPHRDPSRTDKDQRIGRGKGLPVDRLLKRQKAVLLQPCRRVADRAVLPPGGEKPAHGLTAGAAVGKERQPHCVASRNSVVKPGWYKRERIYSSPRHPPTTISAVFFSSFRVAVSWSVPTVQRKMRSSGHVAL